MLIMESHAKRSPEGSVGESHGDCPFLSRAIRRANPAPMNKIQRDKDKELPVSRACSAGGCRGAGWNSWRQNFMMKTLVRRLKERKTLKLNMIEVPSVFLPMLGRTDTERRSSLFIISSFCQTDVGLGKMHTGRQIRTFG